MVLELGSTAAVAQGLLLFATLTILGVLTGLGALALLGVVREPARQVLLAPFMATLVWALPAGLLVRAGVTIVTMMPYVCAVSVALAAIGAWRMVTLGRRGLVAASVAAGCWLAALALVWPWVMSGLTAGLGSGNPDTIMYSSLAAVAWDQGTTIAMPAEEFFQRFWPSSEHVRFGRNHSFVLLGLFSPLVEAGEPMFVRNLLVCWSLFVLACSLAFYGVSRRLARDAGAQSWHVAVLVLVGLGLGWMAVPMLVGNWDNGLVASVGPVAAGLVARRPAAGLAPAVLLGLVAAFGVYTYPELAPVLLLLVLPLMAVHLLDASARRTSLVSFGTAAAIALGLLVVSARPLWDYFVRQIANANNVELVRAGGAFAQGLALAWMDPSAWWTLGAEHLPALAPSKLSLAAALLTAVAALGLLRLIRRRAIGEVTAVGVLGVCVVYFIAVDHYGYGAYKVLSVGWWLVAMMFAEGTAAVVGWRPRVAGVAPQRAVAGVLIACIAVLVFACLAAATMLRWERYAPDAVDRLRPSLASLVRLREAAAAEPQRDVMVSARIDPLALPWIFYALRDSKLRLFHPKSLKGPVWAVDRPVVGGVAWPHDDVAPEGLLLPSQEAKRGRLYFTSQEFELVAVDTVTAIERVANPNRIEAWGMWLGTSPIELTIRGPAGAHLVLRFEAEPGPSLPETRDRTLHLHEGDVALGTQSISGRTIVEFPLATTGRSQLLTLSTSDRPTMARMSNGDERPLLVAIRKLGVAPAPVSP